MPKWISVGANTDQLQDVLRQTADALDTIVTLLNAIQSVVDAIAALILAFESAIKAIIIAVITLIEQLILNVLETNAHIAIHSNLKYDEDWTWKPSTLPNGFPTPNFIEGDVPFNGTGVTGWLSEMSASAYDQTNIFRPITDGQTRVTGVILLVSGPTFTEFKDLIPIFQKVFKNWDAFKIAPKGYEDLEGADRWMAAIKGYWGSRAAELDEGIKEGVEAVKEMYDGLDDAYNDLLPSSFSEALLNSPGPTWVSAPVGAILGEGVRQIADALRSFVNSFTFADSPLIQLLNAISEKIQHLEDLISKISDILDALAALLELLEVVNIYAASEVGGASGFFSNAATAQNVPNVGPNGFAIGATALIASPSADSFLSLFELFGANIQAAVDDATAAVEGVETQAENVVRESEDVGEAFSEIEYD